VIDRTSNASPRALGRRMRIAGWLCVAGIACVIIEMATVLPYLGPTQQQIQSSDRNDAAAIGRQAVVDSSQSQ